jgi:hypothetical protein
MVLLSRWKRCFFSVPNIVPTQPRHGQQNCVTRGVNIPLGDGDIEAFFNAGLPYFNPHSFRATLVQLGEEVCKSPEEFKAWSQNLGHEKVLTTFTSYGTVACQRQGESCGIWPQDNDQSNQMQMKSQKCCLGNSATLVWKYRLNEKLQSRAGSGALTPVRIFGKERLKLIPF